MAGEAFHTYLTVGDATQVRITGLAGVEYIDKTDNFARKVQSDPVITLTAATDRLYLNTTTAVLYPLANGLFRIQVFRKDGTVTAGNASGVNDGAAALIIASEEAVKRHGLTPRAKILGYATAGVPPRVMGVGPVPATQKLMAKTGLAINDFDIIELNEAFAAQALAVLRQLGVADDAAHVNSNGGAIAIGHPLGASGARLALTALRALEEKQGRYALATLCIGVGQGAALAMERV